MLFQNGVGLIYGGLSLWTQVHELGVWLLLGCSGAAPGLLLGCLLLLPIITDYHLLLLIMFKELPEGYQSK